MTPTLACLMTRTMQLQGVALEEKASQESLEEFSIECSRRLTQHDCPSLETLKMHFAVEEANVVSWKHSTTNAKRSHPPSSIISLLSFFSFFRLSARATFHVALESQSTHSASGG